MQRLINSITIIQKKYIYLPYIYAIFGFTCFTIMQLCYKFIGQYITTSQIIYIRSFFLLLINTVLIYFSKSEVYLKDTRVFRLITSRMLTSTFGIYFYFLPIRYISLGILNSLWMLNPLITHILQAFVMNTKLNRNDFFITLFCFSGIILIIKPEFLFGQHKQVENIYYCLMVCVGAFFYAASMVLVRLYKDGVKNDTNLQYFYFGQIISSSLNRFMFDHKVMTKQYTFNFYVLMTFSTIVAYLGQLTFTRSLFLKPAAKIMPFNYVGVIAGLLSDIFIFDKSFDILTILGAGIASSGLIYLIFKK